MQEPSSKKRRIEETEVPSEHERSKNDVDVEEMKEKDISPIEKTNERVMLSALDFICPRPDNDMDSTPLRYVESTLMPTKPNHSLRWFERLGSNYLPTTAFAYEITYPCLNNKINPLQDEYNGIGFAIQYQYLPYSIYSMDRYLTYAIISKVSPNFQHIIAAGDILLKVQNDDFYFKPDDPLVSKEEKGQLYDKFSNLEYNANTTIRILRVAGTSYSSSISVCDILLFATEKNVSARLNVKKSTLMSRDKQHLIKSDLELTYVENNSIRKMLQGPILPWQHIPVLSAAPSSAGYTFVAAINNTNTSNTNPAYYNNGMAMNSMNPHFNMFSPSVSVHQDHLYSSNTNSVTGGIYKDRSKFVSIYSSNIVNDTTSGQYGGTSGSSNQESSILYNLGKYDHESEAKRAFEDAQQSMRHSNNLHANAQMNNNGTNKELVLRHYKQGLRVTVPPPPPPML